MHGNTHSSLPYVLEKTRNRNSRAVLKDDTVIIRLARGLRPSEEERHIRLLLEKMAKAKVREAARSVIDPFRAALEGASEVQVTPVIGHPLFLQLHEGKAMKAKDMGDHWLLSRGAPDPKRLHRLLWRVLSLHVQDATSDLVHRLNDETLRASIRSVSIKFMRSRWGSCSMGGSIALSSPLLLTDSDILRYVIVHELAHTRHPDHSHRFWSTVETHDPAYKDAMRRLRTFRLPQI